MEASTRVLGHRRYKAVSENKANGATYTPKALADFVASQIIHATSFETLSGPLRVLDPAIGDGELLLSLLGLLEQRWDGEIEVFGFDTDTEALAAARNRLENRFPNLRVSLEARDFLSFADEKCHATIEPSVFALPAPERFDLVIANPPYVRTQVMGALQAQQLARDFGLTGRVDLSYAFIVAISLALKPHGVAGVITSNRFMTTRSGAAVRNAITQYAVLNHIWDLGDSKIFSAAVLPAVLLVQGKDAPHRVAPRFTSIYETKNVAYLRATDPVDALALDGVVAVDDGRKFSVRHGTLNLPASSKGVWAISTTETDTWLSQVSNRTWKTFGQIGKIRVGIKTTADKVFIRKDWRDLPSSQQPELLRPLITHHSAGHFRAHNLETPYEVLYPHLCIGGRRITADLDKFPKTRTYLENHRAQLEARTYVIEAGRNWFEIWVPQDPGAWQAPKLVFRDISSEPVFWLDFEGCVVNGDCYWLTCSDENSEDLLWLAAAVANSTFIEVFYDHKFHNKLYAGRRRFITQYVEQFPLPDPNSDLGRLLVRRAKTWYETGSVAPTFREELNSLVWSAFGLPVEEVTR